MELVDFFMYQNLDQMYSARNSASLVAVSRQLGYCLCLFLACVSLIATGCNSEVITSPAPDDDMDYVSMVEQPGSPEVWDSRLRFQTLDDFHSYADYLIANQGPGFLDAFEATLSLFRSLRSETDSLIQNVQRSGGGRDWIGRIVEDPVFETLLNHAGEIQIADSVYKVTRDFLISVPAKDGSVFDGVDWNHILVTYKSPASIESEISSTRVYIVERYSDINAVNAVALKIAGSGDCTGSFKGEGNKREYRIRGGNWIANWGIYRSFGVELESQQRKKKGPFRNWFHHTIYSVSVDASFEHREEGEIVFDTDHYTHTKYNAAEIRHTFEKDRDYSIKEARITTLFEGYDDDGLGGASCVGIRYLG